MAEILGCRADHITGHRLDDFLFPEDVRAERLRLQNRRSAVREQLDRRLRRADGSEVWALACSSLFQSGPGDTVVLTTMTDITEREKAEQAGASPNESTANCSKTFSNGVYQTSPDGRPGAPFFTNRSQVIRWAERFAIRLRERTRRKCKGTMVGAAGFEPATTGLEGRCSIQLSYAPVRLSIVARDQRADPDAARDSLCSRARNASPANSSVSRSSSRAQQACSSCFRFSKMRTFW